MIQNTLRINVRTAMTSNSPPDFTFRQANSLLPHCNAQCCACGLMRLTDVAIIQRWREKPGQVLCTASVRPHLNCNCSTTVRGSLKAGGATTIAGTATDHNGHERFDLGVQCVMMLELWHKLAGLQNSRAVVCPQQCAENAPAMHILTTNVGIIKQPLLHVIGVAVRHIHKSGGA